MNEKIVNLFLQFWNKWLKYRYGDPVFRFARLLVISGITLMTPGGLWWLVVALEIRPKFLPASLTLSIGPETVTYAGIVLSGAGVLLGIWGVRRVRKARSSCLVYLRGMPGMHDQPPTKDLSPKYRYGEVTHLDLDTHDQNPEKALKHIEMIGQMFDEKILSMNLEAPYIVFAGLAPVPLLYAAGVRLSTRQNQRVMDYNRFEQKWHMLDELDDGERVTITYPQRLIGADIAFVLPFTINIAESQIPASLKDKIVWVRLDNAGPRTDAISSDEKLKSILRTVHDAIRNLRSRQGYEHVEKVHLFIGAQASTVFKLGTEYQPNAYPEICVYHFQGGEGRYTWGISISDGQFRILSMYQIKSIF